jgi:ubiquitin C-terminal hydrolase
MQTRRAEEETDGLREAVYVLLEKLPGQQDCQEFLNRVLETVREADAVPFEGESITSVVSLEDDDGYNRGEVTFKQIELVVADFRTLEASLAAWGEWQEGEQLRFPGQTALKRALQQPRIGRLPTILIVQLLRFRWDKKEKRSEKIRTALAFPEAGLDIADVCTEEARYGPTHYNLYAVVVHQGTVLDGHYWAFIKNGETWWKFDNANVSWTSWADVAATGTGNDWLFGSAYLLFYKRVGWEETIAGAEDFCIPPELLGDAAPVNPDWHRDADEEE